VYLIFAVMLVLPQIAFALIGGLIFRRSGLPSGETKTPR
jgi:hypothetical protein